MVTSTKFPVFWWFAYNRNCDINYCCIVIVRRYCAQMLLPTISESQCSSTFNSAALCGFGGSEFRVRIREGCRVFSTNEVREKEKDSSDTVEANGTIAHIRTEQRNHSQKHNKPVNKTTK